MQLEQKSITSVEVSEMVEKQHSELLKDIRRYTAQLAEGNIHLGDFFTESTYPDANKQERPCYLVSKKGCEFIANKLTGTKGAIFTAKYINKFHDMGQLLEEKRVELSPELQMFQSLFKAIANNEQSTKQANELSQRAIDRVESIREVISLDTTSWREDTGNLLRKVSLELGGGQAFSQVRTESYELLDKRFGVDLKQRLTNRRRRMADEGISRSRRDSLSYLDVIAEDKKLVEGYVAIVKDMAIKYGVA